MSLNRRSQRWARKRPLASRFSTVRRHRGAVRAQGLDECCILGYFGEIEPKQARRPDRRRFRCAPPRSSPSPPTDLHAPHPARGTRRAGARSRASPERPRASARRRRAGARTAPPREQRRHVVGTERHMVHQAVARVVVGEAGDQFELRTTRGVSQESDVGAADGDVMDALGHGARVRDEPGAENGPPGSRFTTRSGHVRRLVRAFTCPRDPLRPQDLDESRIQGYIEK